MPVDFILNTGAEILGKKWRAVVIWHLAKGPLRFSQLKAKMPKISVKVLSEVLKEMEKDHLITRTQYNTIPVKVEYRIHPGAEAIVQANYVCTIRIGEYIVNNRKLFEISDDMDLAIRKVLADNRPPDL